MYPLPSGAQGAQKGLAMRTWETEFGEEWDVPHEITARLADESWHNDTCPSFTLDLEDGDTLRLWVDHPDVSRREIPELKRYTLVRESVERTVTDGGRTVGEEDVREELLATDDLRELLSALSEYPEL
jgi:hypothetical protein